VDLLGRAAVVAIDPALVLQEVEALEVALLAAARESVVLLDLPVVGLVQNLEVKLRSTSQGANTQSIPWAVLCGSFA